MKSQANKIWTILDIINWGSEYFQKKGIESPRLNIELMLTEILNYSRIQLYTNYNQPLQKSELEKIKSFALRRSRREPLQYILGKTFFLEYELIVNQSVIVPRPETEELVEIAISSIGEKEEELDFLDIGTGSGCIAIAIAKAFKNSLIIATDIDDKTLATAKENITRNSLSNIVLKKESIFDIEKNSYKYDVIISNPPYISESEFETLQPEIKQFEPKYALTDGSDGLTFYKYFSEIFYELLKPSGKFFLEIGMSQSDSIYNLFDRKRYRIKTHLDTAGIKRFISGTVIKE